MNLDRVREAWINRLIAEGATSEQARASWEYEKARAEWDRYQDAQEAYSLMKEQGEVPS